MCTWPLCLMSAYLLKRAECLIICQITMRTWWHNCWMKAWQIEGRNLFWKMVLEFYWYSRTTVFKIQWQKQMFLNFANIMSTGLKLRTIVPVFFTFSRACLWLGLGEGWERRKDLDSEVCWIFVCFFRGKWEVIEMMVLHFPEGVSLHR